MNHDMYFVPAQMLRTLASVLPALMGKGGVGEGAVRALGADLAGTLQNGVQCVLSTPSSSQSFTCNSVLTIE